MVLEGVEFKPKLGLFRDSRIVLKSSFEMDWILTGSCGTYSSSSFFSFFSTLKQKNKYLFFSKLTHGFGFVFFLSDFRTINANKIAGCCSDNPIPLKGSIKEGIFSFSKNKNSKNQKYSQK